VEATAVPIGEQMTETLEDQVFEWDGWDGDHECMIYYKVILKVQVGKYLPGTPFDSATIMFDTGILQLVNHGECTTDANGCIIAPVTVMGEYKLNLTVGDTIKE
jgi:hypothetical protein